VLFEPRASVRHVRHQHAAPFLSGARAIPTPPLSPLTRGNAQTELPFASRLGEKADAVATGN